MASQYVEGRQAGRDAPAPSGATLADSITNDKPMQRHAVNTRQTLFRQCRRLLQGCQYSRPRVCNFQQRRGCTRNPPAFRNLRARRREDRGRESLGPRQPNEQLAMSVQSWGCLVLAGRKRGWAPLRGRSLRDFSLGVPSIGPTQRRWPASDPTARRPTTGLWAENVLHCTLNQS